MLTPHTPEQNQPISPHVDHSESSTRRRSSPEARREQLLRHAICAFAEAGIERAVHADVAQKANVSTPTVFKYFPTRQALVDAVLERIEFTIKGLLENIPDEVAISSELITRNWSNALSQLCETQPDVMKVSLLWSVAFSSVRDRYIIFENLLLDMLKSRMGTQSADRSDARIMLASATLYIRMHFDGSSLDVRKRYVDRMADMFAAATVAPSLPSAP